MTIKLNGEQEKALKRLMNSFNPDMQKVVDTIEQLTSVMNIRLNELQHIFTGYQMSLMAAYSDHQALLKNNQNALLDKLSDIEARQAITDSLIGKLSNTLILSGNTKLQDVETKVTPSFTIGDVFDISELGINMPNHNIDGISQIKIESEPNQNDVPKDLYSLSQDIVREQLEYLLPLTTPMLKPEALDWLNEAVKEIKPVEAPKPKRKKLGLNWNIDSWDSNDGATGNWYQVDIEDVFLKRSDIAKKRDLLRMIRACKKYKINSIGELMEKSPNEIIKMANMGPHSIIWINTILESLGLNLKKIAA